MLLHSLGSDLRYAIRSLRRAPGFAGATILTIALAIGVNTGIFSLVNGMLFRDLPARDAHELVTIYQTIEGVPDRAAARQQPVSTREFEAYRDGTTTLAGIAGHSDPAGALLSGDDPRQAAGLLVTCGYFEVLGTPPVLGRALTEADCRTGADPVVVLGHETWQTAFGADAAIIGRTIELGRQLFTVVGVAAEGTYGGMFRAEFFAPISMQALLQPGSNDYSNERSGWLHLIGRRGDGVSIGQVRAELGVVAASIDRLEPDRVTTLTVERAKPLTVPPFVRNAALGVGAVVMAAFASILLIACANVANLLLARGAERSREIAVRLSLGASRARVVRQLLIESLLLALAGGLLGSIVALWSFRALLALAMPTVMPVGLPPLGLDVSPDFRVLGLALAVTLATGVLFGLTPALHASRPDLHSVMKQASPGTASRGGGRLQATLVGAQVALCMVLMIGAGLLLRGLHTARTVDPGFAYDAVTVLSYDYVSDTGHAPDSVFWVELQESIAALPGVEGTAYVAREPLGDDYVSAAVRLPGGGDAARSAELNWVSSSYFSVLELPILLGRTFVASELMPESRVAIVSESTARNLWSGRDAVGQTLLWRAPRGEEIEVTIVGVAKDAQVRSLGEIDPYYIYLPARVGEKLLVKSRQDYATTAAGIRNVVRALDPGLPVPVYPLEANLERWRNVSGIVTALAAVLGALALTLAAVGIYGVVAQFVGQRVREIGIRIALGAEVPRVLAMILRRTMRPVVIGATLGVGVGIMVSGILSSMLFGVSPVDALGLLGSTLFVLCVALASGAVVAQRAAHADPTVTLRYE